MSIIEEMPSSMGVRVNEREIRERVYDIETLRAILSMSESRSILRTSPLAPALR